MSNIINNICQALQTFLYYMTYQRLWPTHRPESSRISGRRSSITDSISSGSWYENLSGVLFRKLTIQVAM